MKIIAIAGKKGCGKNAVADLLSTHIGNKKILRLSFADPIRDFLLKIFDGKIRLEQFTNRMMKESPITGLSSGTSPRDLMKKFGSDFAREIHDDIWVEYMGRKIRDQMTKNTHGYHEQKYDYMIVDDLRFENELYMLRYFGAHVLHVIGKEIEEPKSFLDMVFGRKKLHESEAGISQFFNDDKDFVIDNRYSLDFTSEQLHNIVEANFNPKEDQ